MCLWPRKNIHPVIFKHTAQGGAEDDILVWLYQQETVSSLLLELSFICLLLSGSESSLQSVHRYAWKCWGPPHPAAAWSWAPDGEGLSAALS